MGTTTQEHTSREGLLRTLFTAVDASTLAVFRIVFGLLMCIEAVNYYPYVQHLYLRNTFRFPYELYVPWPGDYLSLLIILIGVSALGILLGLLYRFCAIVFFLSFTWFFLLEESQYLNHFYFISLLGFLLCFVNANACWSLDALRKKEEKQVAFWQYALLRYQVFAVYFFGGIAKINWDWLHGEPIRTWFSRRASYPTIGPLLQEEWFIYLVCYGGLLFDLGIGIALLSRRLRWFAFVPLLFFHLTNNQIFSIGVFPWLGIAATSLFLDPDHPRRLIGRFSSRVRIAGYGLECVGLRYRRACLVFVVAYVGWQTIFPLRHWAFPGDVAWTEEGHRFSWRMKLRSKDGFVQLRYLQNGRELVDAQLADLSRRQKSKMAGRPYMLHYYVQTRCQRLREQGVVHPVIYVDNPVSLNGRPFYPLINPEINLCAEEYPMFQAARWLLPLPATYERGVNEPFPGFAVVRERYFNP